MSYDEELDEYQTLTAYRTQRNEFFIALMCISGKVGLDCGWSRLLSNGDTLPDKGWVCAWITAPTGRQVRLAVEDRGRLPPELERQYSSPSHIDEDVFGAIGDITKAFNRIQIDKV